MQQMEKDEASRTAAAENSLQARATALDETQTALEAEKSGLAAQQAQIDQGKVNPVYKHANLT